MEVGDVLRVWDERRTRSALFAVLSPEPQVVCLCWEGGDVPGADELAALPPLLDLDPEEDGADAVHAFPLQWAIVTGRKSEVFGPHIGEIVARGVERPEEAGQPDSYGAWEGLRAFLGGPWFDACLSETRRRIAHEPADAGVEVGDVVRIGNTLYAVQRIDGEHVLPGCPVLVALEHDAAAVESPVDLARIPARSLMARSAEALPREEVALAHTLTP